MSSSSSGFTTAGELRDLVAEYGGRGKRLGVEYHAYGLTAQRGRMVDAAFAGFCELVDASDLVRLLRLVKARPSWPICDRPGGSSTRPVRCRAA